MDPFPPEVWHIILSYPTQIRDLPNLLTVSHEFSAEVVFSVSEICGAGIVPYSRFRQYKNIVQIIDTTVVLASRREVEVAAASKLRTVTYLLDDKLYRSNEEALSLITTFYRTRWSGIGPGGCTITYWDGDRLLFVGCTNDIVHTNITECQDLVPLGCTVMYSRQLQPMVVLEPILREGLTACYPSRRKVLETEMISQGVVRGILVNIIESIADGDQNLLYSIQPLLHDCGWQLDRIYYARDDVTGCPQLYMERTSVGDITMDEWCASILSQYTHKVTPHAYVSAILAGKI